MKKNRKIGIIATEPVMTISTHDGMAKREAIRRAAASSTTNYTHEIKQPTFKTKEELNEFLEQTKYIRIKKVPKMPFTLLKHFVREYQLIYSKKSKLTGVQRIHVKNVVHYNVRKGTIILK